MRARTQEGTDAFQGGATAKPRRRVGIQLRLGADSWEDAADALEQMAFEIKRRGLRGPVAVSGGYSSGYVYEASEDESITHDSWFTALNGYLAAVGSPSTEDTGGEDGR